MAKKKEGGFTRSFWFEDRIWHALDADAERSGRSSVKQLEVLLATYYDLNADFDLNTDKIKAMKEMGNFKSLAPVKTVPKTAKKT